MGWDGILTGNRGEKVKLFGIEVFNNKQQVQEERVSVSEVDGSALLQALINSEDVTVEQAMSIPAFSSSVHLISDTIASLPIKLYKTTDEKTECVEDDIRVALLNKETGDTLNSFEFKKMMVMDYLIHGNAYAFVNKKRNGVKSINYVDQESIVVMNNFDPIYKRNDIMVNSQTYRDYQFIKFLRGNKGKGVGKGIFEENIAMLNVAYQTMMFEYMLVATGGNKKGFLKSEGRLSETAMTTLKDAFKSLYQNNTDNIVVLNAGLEFQEASNSATEMMLNQNKVSNNQEIYEMFNIPYELMNGKATGGNEEIYHAFVKLAILPLLEAFEKAVDSVLLTEEEKKSYKFEFDTMNLLKGDIEKRFKAYEIAVTQGIMQIDEIRHMEDLEPLELDFIKLGLADVLYNPKTKEIYTPNTNAIAKMGDEIKVDNNDPNSANGSSSPKAEKPQVKGGEKKNESGSSQ